MDREAAQVSTCPSATAHTPSPHAVGHFRPRGISESAPEHGIGGHLLSSASLPGGPLQPSTVHATPGWPPRGTHTRQRARTHTHTHTDIRSTHALTRQGLESRATGPEDPLRHREPSRGAARVSRRERKLGAGVSKTHKPTAAARDTAAGCPPSSPGPRRGHSAEGRGAWRQKGGGGGSRVHSGQGLDRGTSRAEAGHPLAERRGLEPV